MVNYSDSFAKFIRSATFGNLDYWNGLKQIAKTEFVKQKMSLLQLENTFHLLLEISKYFVFLILATFSMYSLCFYF